VYGNSLKLEREGGERGKREREGREGGEREGREGGVTIIN